MIRALVLLSLASAAEPVLAADGSPAPRRAARAVRTGRTGHTGHTPSRTSRVAAAEPDPGVAAVSVHHPAGMGAVLHVTPTRAYLDVGAEQGLAPGQSLRLLRAGSLVASCDVEAVAPRHATCKPDGTVKRGDLFRVSPPPGPPPPKPLPPLVEAEELDRRAVAVAEQPHGKVESKAPPPVALDARPRRAEVGLSVAHWGSSGATGWQQERLDAAVHGAPAFAGLTLDADVQAVRWSSRPQGFRARPTSQTQFYVYEASLSSRDASRGWSGALGRVLPWNVPGASTFDGLQLALVKQDHGGELGVFGGLVPDPITLGLASDRSTAGVYGSLDLGGRTLMTRSQARAAVVTSPELGSRFEAEVRSYALVSRTVNVEGMLRAGVGGRYQAPGALDLAQVDVSGRPVPRVALSALFRYAGLDVPDAVAPALYPGHERRFDGSAGYEIGPALVSASGGWGQDLGTGLERWFAGPELAFPRLFGVRGGVSFGYAEERGWIAGRTAWAQASLRPLAGLRMSGRLTWTEDTRAGGDSDQAIGLLYAASADLNRWLSVNASVLARVGAMGGSAGLQNTATGVVLRGGLVGRF